MMRCSNKLVHVQHKWKEGRQGIRAYDDVSRLYDGRPFHDPREGDEEIDHWSRLEVRASIADHHGRTLDVPALDRPALSASRGER